MPGVRHGLATYFLLMTVLFLEGPILGAAMQLRAFWRNISGRLGR